MAYYLWWDRPVAGRRKTRRCIRQRRIHFIANYKTDDLESLIIESDSYFGFWRTYLRLLRRKERNRRTSSLPTD
jgi:hypothetical protein